MTVSTRATEAPLSHGHFPGPPDSDRAYEQVSPPETSGNPVAATQRISPQGNRAVYTIAGGTPLSEEGSFFGFYFAERHAGGWQTENITPPRSRLAGTAWGTPQGPADLSSMVVWNLDESTESGAGWRLTPGAPATLLFEYADPIEGGFSPFHEAPESSQVLAGLKGGELDPAYPAAAAHFNLYDVTTGTPRLVSFLPGNSLASCDLSTGFNSSSDDGSYVLYGCVSGHLYLRDLVAETTKRLAPQPVSGTDCETEYAVGTSTTAVFFSSKSRLTAEDTAPSSCSSGLSSDVYRYDIGDESLRCVTCLAASPEDAGDGSTYVLDLDSGQLRWVGPDIEIEQSNLSRSDGSVALFRSADPRLNPLGGGGDNGAKAQFYRYDDHDRSITCLSCPQDGTPATAPVSGGSQSSADGSDVAFDTPTPLLGADQNTPAAGHDPVGGSDVYEWRDGRLFLITDGLTNWPAEPPHVQDVSASGRDVFFIAAAQYTPDALDAFQRLYDARVGGGFEFPTPPKPCPLEVCQGTPKGAPEEQPPGTGSFTGPANQPPKARGCPKGERKAHAANKVRCVAKHHNHKRANHKRRAPR
jgi:hypothetical protein